MRSKSPVCDCCFGSTGFCGGFRSVCVLGDGEEFGAPAELLQQLIHRLLTHTTLVASLFLFWDRVNKITHPTYSVSSLSLSLSLSLFIYIYIYQQSHTHKGAHDDPNGSHISIQVVSDKFTGKRAVQRQQMVYKAIWEEMQGAVHAVDEMVCKTPAEA
jgi:stress-induced morphogen